MIITIDTGFLLEYKIDIETYIALYLLYTLDTDITHEQKSQFVKALDNLSKEKCLFYSTAKIEEAVERDLIRSGTPNPDSILDFFVTKKFKKMYNEYFKPIKKNTWFQELWDAYPLSTTINGSNFIWKKVDSFEELENRYLRYIEGDLETHLHVLKVVNHLKLTNNIGMKLQSFIESTIWKDSSFDNINEVDITISFSAPYEDDPNIF